MQLLDMEVLLERGGVGGIGPNEGPESVPGKLLQACVLGHSCDHARLEGVRLSWLVKIWSVVGLRRNRD
jgi:hypothetical protein